MGLREAVDAAHRTLSTAMLEVISAKRAAPAGDLASWLVQHPARMSETELIHQMAILYATGTEPTWNLIAVTVLLPVTDERLGGELLGGALSTRDAIDEVLFSDPPRPIPVSDIPFTTPDAPNAACSRPPWTTSP
jgi:hypothetical protein